MAPPSQANDVAIRAKALDAEARHHKREERRHRNAARAAREKLAALQTQCGELGIDLSVTSDPTTGEGPSPWPKTLSSTSTR